MKTKYSAFLLFLILFTTLAVAEVNETVLGKIILPVPKISAHQDYLGLKEETAFTIPRIKADVVVIEIFSMYCPHCQREAPYVNELYQKIENNKNLKERVKLIGIGVGNSDFEVEFFRKKYNIPFPLFSDSDFSIHKKLSQVRTPYFLCVKIDGKGISEIFYSKPGGIVDADKFLDMIMGN